jgi:hypothetical protein
MNNAIFFILIVFTTACTSVKYNGTKTYISEVSYPEVGKVVTAYVGDHLVRKGNITQEYVLHVYKAIDGVLYDIPAKKYPQVGFDEKMISIVLLVYYVVVFPTQFKRWR